MNNPLHKLKTLGHTLVLWAFSGIIIGMSLFLITNVARGNDEIPYQDDTAAAIETMEASNQSRHTAEQSVLAAEEALLKAKVAHTEASEVSCHSTLLTLKLKYRDTLAAGEYEEELKRISEKADSVRLLCGFQ
jgi:hypothetical protein